MQPANICDLFKIIVQGQGTFVSAENKKEAINSGEDGSQDKEVIDGSTQPGVGSIQ